MRRVALGPLFLFGLVLACVIGVGITLAAQSYNYTYVAGDGSVFGHAAVAIGYESEAGEDSLANGFRARARGKTSLAMGSGSDCGGDLSYSNVCLGDDAAVVEVYDYDKFAATVTGRIAKGGRFAAVYGHDAQGVRYTTVFGEGSRCTHQGSGCFGRGAESTRYDQLMLGAPAMPYKEINVSGRVVWQNGTGAPTDAAPPASLYSRLDGPPYLYVYEGDHWEPK